MAIEEINAKGGVLGRKLEPVVVDPASNWPLFAEKARELLAKDKVAVVFGCWTSVSRKSVLPVFEELNGLLFYPVQYEGEESSNNVFYTGAAPEPAGDPRGRISDEQGGRRRQALRSARHRLRLSAHDEQDPALLPAFEGRRRRRHHGGVHAVRSQRLSDHRRRHQEVRRRAARRRWSRRSTATPTCPSTRSSATRASRRPRSRSWRSPSARRSCAASTPSRWSATWRRGTTSCRSITPTTRRSSTKWTAYAKAHNLPDGDKRVTNDPMEATYIGVHMWAQAVEKAKTTEVDR